ncbi:hypothetical protein NUW58_g9279 [Xylaria curta]|uniref:Uncharacterized protein n=1 Tax=Xylaria curta TaxID=42375 RepID=A0ACC1N0K2_9PEZI|nr:hypothetical protein NUW58_g9279 [Xylaria curta]
MYQIPKYRCRTGLFPVPLVHGLPPPVSATPTGLKQAGKLPNTPSDNPQRQPPHTRVTSNADSIPNISDEIDDHSRASLHYRLHLGSKFVASSSGPRFEVFPAVGQFPSRRLRSLTVSSRQPASASPCIELQGPVRLTYDCQFPPSARSAHCCNPPGPRQVLIRASPPICAAASCPIGYHGPKQSPGILQRRCFSGAMSLRYRGHPESRVTNSTSAA